MVAQAGPWVHLCFGGGSVDGEREQGADGLGLVLGVGEGPVEVERYLGVPGVPCVPSVPCLSPAYLAVRPKATKKRRWDAGTIVRCGLSLLASACGHVVRGQLGCEWVGIS